MNIGENIRRYREAAGLSWTELSRLTGISRQTITRYEQGSQNPKLYAIFTLARALRVKPGDLDDRLSGVATPPPANPCADKPDELAELCREWGSLSADTQAMILAVARTAIKKDAQKHDKTKVA